MRDVIIKLKNITKFFPGVTALRDVDLELHSGEVHGLIGENGAGKSTLIKVITGVNMPDTGEIEMEGEIVKFHNPMDAKRKGIACVYQELNIEKELSVTDNLFMGNYVKRKSGFLNYDYMNRRASEIMTSMNQTVDCSTLCGDLGMGIQQMVEIGKSILMDAKVLVLDEPTSSLGEKETAELVHIVKMLKEQGLAILFVSHKLEEIFEMCDVVTVMRDAQRIVTKKASDVTKDELITYMVGHKMEDFYPHIETTVTNVALEARDITRQGSFSHVSFCARHGEVLGFSGLVGAGRTEVFRCLFGVDPLDAGEIFVSGQKVAVKQPKDAIRAGIAFVTEDRKGQGLVLNEPVFRNIALANLRKFKRGPLIHWSGVQEQAKRMVSELKIKTASIDTEVVTLSGGNQQKIVIAKWLNTDANIFIFDEPTRGIDIGAKVEVYNVMKNLAKQGKCVIMVSSELPEIMGMCDRVIVMREGSVMAEIEKDSPYFTQEAIMHAAWGGALNHE